MPLDNYTMFKLREAQERAKTASLANAMDYAKGLGAGMAGFPGDTANLINALLHVRPTGYGSEDIGRMMGANTGSGAFLAGNLGMPDMSDALKVGTLITGKFGAKLAEKAAKANRSVLSGDYAPDVRGFVKDNMRELVQKPAPIRPVEKPIFENVDYGKFMRDNKIEIMPQGNTRKQDGKIVADFYEAYLGDIVGSGRTVEEAIDDILYQFDAGGGEIDIPRVR